VAVVVVAVAFLLAWFSDLRKMRRLRAQRGISVARYPAAKWPNDKAVTTLRQGRRD